MATELQDLLYDFVKARMSEEAQRMISSSAQILNTLDEESENEIKDELYRLLLQDVCWSQLVNRIHSTLPDLEDEDEHKSESESECESEEED